MKVMLNQYRIRNKGIFQWNNIGYFPVRVMYIWMVAFAFLVFFGLIWFFFNVVVQIMIGSMMSGFGSYFNSDPMYAKTNVFFTNIWLYMLILSTFGLLIWVYVNSQKPKDMLQ